MLRCTSYQIQKGLATLLSTHICGPSIRGDMDDRKTTWVCGFLHVTSRDIVVEWIEWIMTYWDGRRPPTLEIQSQNISFFFTFQLQRHFDTYKRRTQATTPGTFTPRCHLRATVYHNARCSPTQAAVWPPLNLEVNLGSSCEPCAAGTW